MINKLLIALVFLIFCNICNAQESQNLPQATQSSTTTNVPKKYQDDKFIQLVLAELKFQTQRAENAENSVKEKNGQITELKESRTDWKNLYIEKTVDYNKLKVAYDESQASNQSYIKADAQSVNQRDLDKQFRNSQAQQIKDLKKSRFKFFFTGFATGTIFGFGTCVAAHF